MKVTLNWLKQYVDFDWSPEELTERLTLLGLEVEGTVKLGGEFDGVIVAKVLSKDRHPNADKLWLCRVQDGKSERQIVCGAQNFNAGDLVPLALPGTTMPAKPGEAPFTIKTAKVRGVESHGMMCSPQELGLPDAVDGLFLLRPDAVPGQSFAQYLGRTGSDVVYDLEITPNRPDLNSLIGIAREIAALTGNPLRLPEPALVESAPPAADLAAVRLEDAELCPRYTARIIRGVRIGPSPEWLRRALETVGLRSINNVVDVTNYVMLETGQPLHAFDYHLVAKGADGKPVIVVRRAREGETFVTLDNQSHTLTADNLLIADEQKGIALAGVMGGLNSEIKDSTTDVLLESAYFSPAGIRRTSKRLNLRTDASYRYERGADPVCAEFASRRAAQLIVETAGGQLASGVVDAYPAPAAPRQVTLRHSKANDLLGLQLAPSEMEDYLIRLGLKTTGRKPRPVGAEAAAPDPVAFLIPSWRVDIKREADLIEEIARLFGVDKIPSTPPRCVLGAHPYDAVHDQLAEARRILTGQGLDEAQGQTLISDVSARLAVAEPVPLSNPLSSDMNVLRPSLLPGLLDSLRHNLSRRNADVALFEIGRVFRSLNNQTKEERRVAIVLTGARHPLFWAGEDREAACDIFDLKGILEEFLELFGLRGISFVKRAAGSELYLEAADIVLGKQPLGELGQLPPALARKYDVRNAVLLAELNLDLLLARRNPARSYKPLPQYPAIRRDVAMLVPETVTHDAVLQAVRQAKAPDIETVELFDVFRGKNVPAGQKSMAYAFTYRSAAATLTDNQVNAAQQKLVDYLKTALQATVRDA